MFVRSWNFCLRVLTAVFVGSALLTLEANATYYGNWDVHSDAGTYSPVAYGDDLQFNACASTIFNVYNSARTYSICDLPSVDKFRLHWYQYEPSLGVRYMASYVGANAVNGLTPTFATGAGTYFPVQSTYYIGLYLIAEANAYIDLPDGTTAFTGAGTLGDFRWSNAFNVVAPVSEPTALLLLLPGLAYLALRQRRRRKL